MFKVIWNKIISSDWHLFHKNILLYEFEYRKKYLKWTILENINSVEELELEYKKYAELEKNGWNYEIEKAIDKATENFLLDVINSLLSIDLSKIDEYYNLGDFLFNPNELRLQKIKSKPYNMLINNINEILDFYHIKKFFCIWNHDLPKKVNEKNKELIKESDIYKYLNSIFDDIFDYKIVWTEIFSHMPLWVQYSKYTSWSYHMEIDKYLIDIIKHSNQWEVITCYHGHTHSSDPNITLDGIKYINCSVEKNL